MMRQRCVQRLLPVRLMWIVWVREFASTPNAKRPVLPIQIAQEPEPVMKTGAVLHQRCASLSKTVPMAKFASMVNVLSAVPSTMTATAAKSASKVNAGMDVALRAVRLVNSAMW